MPVSTLQMRVIKYIPDRLYGFAANGEGQEVFFHLGAFDPSMAFGTPSQCNSCPDKSCSWMSAPPPPILGESVEVEVDLLVLDERAPRAERVRRIHTPKAVRGEVETFDAVRGYGFIAGRDGVSYHLHKSEVLDGRLPIINQAVSFFAGIRQDRPRACHVKVCP